jgi:hypothetical protein
LTELTSAIVRRQNDPPMHVLLRAMSASHVRAQRLDATTTVISILVAASGIVGTLVASAAMPITVVGGLWALAYSTGFASWTGSELSRAATIQEMFDARLFSLPWNAVVAGEEVHASEVSRLSKRYRGREDMIVDYYEIPRTLVRPYDVMACQMQNLGWGGRVRRRFAFTILVCLCIWCAAGIVVGGLAGVTVAQLVLSWYVPSLGGLMLGLDMFRKQYATVTERHRVLRLVQTAVASSAQQPILDVIDGLLVLARQVQDAIYLTRVSTPRVPDWFFLRFRASDRIDFQAAVDELEQVLWRRHARPAPTANELTGEHGPF